MEIRVQRTIAVLPQHARNFISLALKVAERSQQVMGIESEVFYNPHSGGDTMEFKVFTDFDSLATYESRFLGALLHDTNYLQLAANAVEMILDEPRDEMLVRLTPDDFFMNLGGPVQRREFNFEMAPPTMPASPARFRRVREYTASKGQLREVMKMNFEFIDNFYGATGGGLPSYYCTRFATLRIGSSMLFYDSDECPICTPSFIEQDEDIAANRAGLLVRRPIDLLYTRVDGAMASFSLAGVAP